MWLLGEGGGGGIRIAVSRGCKEGGRFVSARIGHSLQILVFEAVFFGSRGARGGRVWNSRGGEGRLAKGKHGRNEFLLKKNHITDADFALRDSLQTFDSFRIRVIFCVFGHWCVKGGEWNEGQA